MLLPLPFLLEIIGIIHVFPESCEPTNNIVIMTSNFHKMLSNLKTSHNSILDSNHRLIVFIMISKEENTLSLLKEYD